jgi:hypothetical protein
VAPFLDVPGALPRRQPHRRRGRWRSAATFDFTQLRPYAKPVFPYLLNDLGRWAGAIADTVAEGDEVAGFEVVLLPATRRASSACGAQPDRLALVSDCFYTLDP